MSQYRSQVVHRRLGGMDGTTTACFLRAIQHRPLKYTDDDAQVTCKSCRAWLPKP